MLDSGEMIRFILTYSRGVNFLKVGRTKSEPASESFMPSREEWSRLPRGREDSWKTMLNTGPFCGAISERVLMSRDVISIKNDVVMICCSSRRLEVSTILRQESVRDLFE